MEIHTTGLAYKPAKHFFEALKEQSHQGSWTLDSTTRHSQATLPRMDGLAGKLLSWENSLLRGLGPVPPMSPC